MPYATSSISTRDNCLSLAACFRRYLSASASQLLHSSSPQASKTRLEGCPRLHQLHGHGDPSCLEPPWRSSSEGSLIMEPRVVAFSGATSSTSKYVRIAQMAQSSHVHSLCPPSWAAHASTHWHVVALKQGANSLPRLFSSPMEKSGLLLG
jgi:hypothetical protein